MRRLAGIIGTLAVGALMTAAGVLMDATTLLYGGIVLLGLAAVLWLYDWGRRPSAAERMSRDHAIARSIANVSGAVGNALGYDDDDRIIKTVPMVDSVLATVAKQYGIARPRLPDDPREALKHGLAYLAEVAPYLQAGHRDEATRKALAFVRKHGSYRH